MDSKTEELVLKLKPTRSLDPVYFQTVDPRKADVIAEELLRLIVSEKIYRQTDISAKAVSEMLGVKSRDFSAIVNMRFAQSFPALINEYRVREVQFLLKDLRLRDVSVWEIGKLVGYKNRQSFYSAFTKIMGYSPQEWRKLFLPHFEKD